jgi:hypothetical protein
MQMQASLPLESPRSLEPNGYSSNTPPPRPARAALRSSSNLGLPRSPSTPALSNESPASVLVARDLASSPSIPLIHKALENSKDGGETLDLSREHIHHISDDEVEFFRTRVGKHNTGVWRLALSYNALADGSISRSFNTLSRLRYLNLKGNQFTAIPPAVSCRDRAFN